MVADIQNRLAVRCWRLVQPRKNIPKQAVAKGRSSCRRSLHGGKAPVANGEKRKFAGTVFELNGQRFLRVGRY